MVNDGRPRSRHRLSRHLPSISERLWKLGYQLLKFGLGRGPGGTGTHVSLRAERERKFSDVVPVGGINISNVARMKRSEIRACRSRLARSLSTGGASRRPVGSMRATESTALIPLVRQHRQGMDLDPFLVQLSRLVGRGLAVDRAVVDLAVVHLAGLLGKFRPDIVGVPGQVLAQLLELLAQLAFPRRHHGDRRLFVRLIVGLFTRRFVSWRRCLLAPARAGDARAHDFLLDLRGSADRAGDQLLPRLLVVGRGILEPAFEGMALGAVERVADHRGSPTARNLSGSASGSIISKRRPCCREGTRPRAAATAARSTSANTMPGSTPPSPRTRPQGSTTREWP